MSCVFYLFILFNSSTFAIHKVHLISHNDVERSRQVAALEPVHKLIKGKKHKFKKDIYIQINAKKETR